jgi:hypothetical protein
MSTIRDLSVITLAGLITLYGALLCLLSIIFTEVTPFIGGLMFIGCGAVALNAYKLKFNEIAKEVF